MRPETEAACVAVMGVAWAALAVVMVIRTDWREASNYALIAWLHLRIWQLTSRHSVRHQRRTPQDAS